MSPYTTSDGDTEAEVLVDSLNGTKTPPTYPEEKLEKDINPRPFKRKIVWPNAIGFLIVHLLAVHASYLYFFVISWKLFIYSTLLGVLVSQGVTMGAHRLFAHRAFKATRALSASLLILQTISSQNCLWIWVRDHRQHHKHADTDADPHNANNGFFFSHIGWLMTKKHPLVIEKGKGIDMSDLEADPLIMFQKRYYKTLWLVFSFFLPTAFAVYCLGESWYHCLMVAFLLRIIAVLNFTWMVNSWAHKFGTKPYDKLAAVGADVEGKCWFVIGPIALPSSPIAGYGRRWNQSRLISVPCPNPYQLLPISQLENRTPLQNMLAVETLAVSIMAFGEGWHNYHHVFPWDYRASEFGVSYNPTTATIDLCAYFGWAYDLKAASPKMAALRADKTGDGSLAICQRSTETRSNLMSGRNRG